MNEVSVGSLIILDAAGSGREELRRTCDVCALYVSPIYLTLTVHRYLVRVVASCRRACPSIRTDNKFLLRACGSEQL